MIHSTPFKRNPFATQLCRRIDDTTTCFKSEIRRKNKPKPRVHNSAGKPHSSTIMANSLSCLSFIRYLVCFVCVIKIVAQLPSNSLTLMFFFTLLCKLSCSALLNATTTKLIRTVGNPSHMTSFFALRWSLPLLPTS